MHGNGAPSDASRGASLSALLRQILPVGRQDLIATLLLAVVYGAVAAASLRWVTESGAGVVVWPAGGLALAALYVRGPRLWPGVFIGHLAATAAIGPAVPPGAQLILSAGAAIAAAVPAVLLRRRQIEANLTTLPDALWLIVLGGLGGAAILAAAGVLAIGAGAPLAHPAAWTLGALAGILCVAPALLSWRPSGGQALRPLAVLHLAVAVTLCGVMAYAIFLRPDLPFLRAWFLFPLLVWAALAFSVRGLTLAMLVVAVIIFAAEVQGIGPFANVAGEAGRRLLTQQFAVIAAATGLILAAVADERRGGEAMRLSAQRLREETDALELLNRTGAAIAAELELDRAVQRVTDAGVSLSGAQFGAFFYNVVDDAGEALMLYALSGAPRSAFERFGQPRNTAVFAPTFTGEGPVRVDDITRDARYGQSAPHHGMPKGHLAVKSYMAVPVRSRSGEVLGGLFFGHARSGVFTERAERLVLGVAAQAAVAIDNARLYQAAQREIAERRRAEEHQRLLMNELNHRVKNTLATVQSMGVQSLRAGRSLAEAKEAFVSRLMALSAAHNLLTAERWESADLEDLVRMGVAPFDEPPGTRFTVQGPGLRLKASQALGLAMALHELGANASKYGALSGEGGTVKVQWDVTPVDEAGDTLIHFVWQERDGPTVEPPLRRGFGSRLILEGLKRELQAEVSMDYRPGGLCCELRFQAPLAIVPLDDPDA